PGRRRVWRRAGLTRRRYDDLMAQLEAKGAIVDRRPLRAGRLADRTVAATLDRLSPLTPTPPLPRRRGGSELRLNHREVDTAALLAVD
ncbi:MAG: hypothetical protein HW416_2067, partial [Chloroflexi bacterium]|nr:hypothetical protein [Chloroflexota bacterium]